MLNLTRLPQHTPVEVDLRSKNNDLLDSDLRFFFASGLRELEADGDPAGVLVLGIGEAPLEVMTERFSAGGEGDGENEESREQPSPDRHRFAFLVSSSLTVSTETAFIR
jgi:hypothetical protein